MWFSGTLNFKFIFLQLNFGGGKLILIELLNLNVRVGFCHFGDCFLSGSLVSWHFNEMLGAETDLVGMDSVSWGKNQCRPASPCALWCIEFFCKWVVFISSLGWGCWGFGMHATTSEETFTHVLKGSFVQWER